MPDYRPALAIAIALTLAPVPALAFAMTAGGGVQTALGTFDLGQYSPYAGQPGVVTEDFATPAGCGASKVSVTGAYTFGAVTLVNRRRLPDSDRSCYFSLGKAQAVAAATIGFTVPVGKRIDYIGFYWGSADLYNHLSFNNGSGYRIPIGTANDEVTGADLIGAPGGPLVRQSGFVAFDFTVAEVVRSITLAQTDYAFEIDNLSYRLVDVFAPPAPLIQTLSVTVDAPASAPIAAFGFAFAFAARRRSYQSGAIGDRSRQKRGASARYLDDTRT